MTSKRLITILVLIELVTILVFVAYITTNKCAFDTKYAYFFRLRDSSYIVILKPNFLQHIFGSNWKEKKIYCKGTGYHGLKPLEVKIVCLGDMTLYGKNEYLSIENHKGKATRDHLLFYSIEDKTSVAVDIIVHQHKVEIMDKIFQPDNIHAFLPDGSLIWPPRKDNPLVELYYKNNNTDSNQLKQR